MDESLPGELRRSALAALLTTDCDERCAAVASLVGIEAIDPVTEIAEPPGVPGRPSRPLLVPPSQVPKRSAATLQGRAALLHALAHIEYNAVGLALDHLWRFAALPLDYYRDWLQVAVEEARHFSMLRARLRDSGFDYGDFPAHDGLWEMARKTAGDALARMALVPRTLEARGLDASPAIRAKFAAAGDPESAAVIDVILHDEVGHVAIGNRWFRHLCAQRGVDPLRVYPELAQRHGAARPRGPFNIEARVRAGFTAEELAALQAAASN